MGVERIAGRSVLAVPEQPSFLARYPAAGIAFALICALGFSILAFNVLHNGPLVHQDQPLAQALHQEARHGPWIILLVLYGFSATGREGIILISLLLSIIWIRQKRWRELTMLIYGAGGGELLFQALGGLIDRPRPSYPDPIEVIHGAGFPSGHTTTSIILFGLILYLLWPRLPSKTWRAVGLFALILLIGLIGFARMYIGTHYLTDILGGVFTGLVWGTAVVTGVEAAFWGSLSNRQRKIHRAGSDQV